MNPSAPRLAQKSGWRRTPFTRLVRHTIERVMHGGDESGELDFGIGAMLALLAAPGAFASVAASLSDEYFFIVLAMVATANITAAAPPTVYELTKADLKPILEARPEIAQELSRAMAQRLEAGRGLLTIDLDGTGPTRGSSAWFSQHIRRLFAHSITN